MLAEMLKGIARQWLSKAIGDYVPYRTILKLNLIVLNIFIKEYIFSIYILSLAIISKVFSKSYGPLVIIEDNNGQHNSIG